MNRKKLVVALLTLGLFSLGIAGLAAVKLGVIGGSRFYGTPYPDSPVAPEFTLTDHRGEQSSLSDFRGRTVLLFFGFTRCPDVCPLTLDRLSQVLDETDLGPDRVAVLLVTVDPEYDSPERLADYVAHFGPSVTGLTADRTTLEAVYVAYGVYAREMPGHDGEAVLAHNPQVFGIDADGRLQVLIHPEDPAEQVGSDIRKLASAGR
ncbi:MAG: SCO family protein [Gemmatimonadota bacterium]|nr:SCO family protein [Gemmatimonadota bacterium]